VALVINKDQRVSWQTHLIDLDGAWGLSGISAHNFSIPDGTVEFICENNNTLFEALMELNGKDFATLDDFLNRLGITSKQTVTAQEQREVLKSLQQRIFWEDILPKLKDFEEKRWFEIDQEFYGKKGKSNDYLVKVSEIIRDAQKRLETLKLDDHDELYSMRLTGKIRIWGIREAGYLKILWFDLEHAICPSLRD